jgi:hypothetical protein
VDARLHHLQGEAEGVSGPDLGPLLQEFYAERLGLLQRHVASAAVVTDYDVNNAYQYIIAREETHVYWVHRAILDVGATVPSDPASLLAPTGRPLDVMAADAAANHAFVQRWTPRLAPITHARHRKMLEVILGEMQEHERLFQQAADGRTDIIGTPVAGTVRHGVVLGTRWVE